MRDWWVEGDRLRYRMEVDLSKAVGELDQVNPVWDLRLEIQRGHETNVSRFAIDPAMVSGQRIPVRTRLGGAAVGYVEPFVTQRLDLAFEQVADTPLSQVGARADLLRKRAAQSVRWRSSEGGRQTTQP